MRKVVNGDLQDVMDVENTVSPKILFGAPNERPRYDCPVLRCKTAGGIPTGAAWVAKVAHRMTRDKRTRRGNMMLSEIGLEAEETENEVTKIAGRILASNSRIDR